MSGYVDCKCGHTRALHPERTEEACVFTGCGCEEYRPVTLDRIVTGGRLPRATDAQPEPTYEKLIAEARRSPLPKVARAAEKIDGLLSDLRILVRETAAERTIREEIAQLERTLAARKAALRGSNPTEHACTRDGCAQTFTTGQGRALHERRAHDGFDPHTQAAS